MTFAADGTELGGSLTLVPDATGVVVFAHGSGSSRFSPRNRKVAAALEETGLTTLLIDLLSVDEERVDRETAQLRFDIPLLGRRLVAATDWLADQPDTAALAIGYFGASTGAAAALIAAAERRNTAAIVSRGGRPDLAGDALRNVRAPTLLIVGEHDPQVLELNEAALDELDTEKGLAIVPGATHLFEEPGAIGDVTRLARDWFVRHL
ncbi:MAG: dienelactone hydrolase family protein [Actinomycetota bacterium]|nr:dienelactone hydrolase family protein [Actinomycetota bacterium]MDP9303434.1 dienelactone hydrolase family protein [Actinomycetota bacterium]